MDSPPTFSPGADQQVRRLFLLAKLAYLRKAPRDVIRRFEDALSDVLACIDTCGDTEDRLHLERLLRSVRHYPDLLNATGDNHLAPEWSEALLWLGVYRHTFRSSIFIFKGMMHREVSRVGLRHTSYHQEVTPTQFAHVLRTRRFLSPTVHVVAHGNFLSLRGENEEEGVLSFQELTRCLLDREAENLPPIQRLVIFACNAGQARMSDVTTMAACFPNMEILAFAVKVSGESRSISERLKTKMPKEKFETSVYSLPDEWIQAILFARAYDYDDFKRSCAFIPPPHIPSVAVFNFKEKCTQEDSVAALFGALIRSMGRHGGNEKHFEMLFHLHFLTRFYTIEGGENRLREILQHIKSLKSNIARGEMLERLYEAYRKCDRGHIDGWRVAIINLEPTSFMNKWFNHITFLSRSFLDDLETLRTQEEFQDYECRIECLKLHSQAMAPIIDSEDESDIYMHIAHPRPVLELLMRIMFWHTGSQTDEGFAFWKAVYPDDESALHAKLRLVGMFATLMETKAVLYQQAVDKWYSLPIPQRNMVIELIAAYVFPMLGRVSLDRTVFQQSSLLVTRDASRRSLVAFCKRVFQYILSVLPPGEV